jgi:ABC-2 type transport system permease protein
MMLRIGLRFHRTGMISTAAIGGLNGMLQSLGFKAIVGNSEAARQQFGLQMQVLGRQVSYLVPLPVHPETLAGYVQWRVFGFFPLIFGFWALMAGSGVIRGDEERGLLELWLASRISRARLTAARSAAFVIAVGGAIVVACVLTAFGANAAASPLPIDGLLADGAALLALTAACFGIALLIAQFADSRRVAAGVGAIVLLGLFLLNSFGRTLDGLARVRGVSPFFYYDRVNGLSPGGRVDWVSTLDLAVAALVLIVLAAIAFARRDLGSGLVRRRPVERPPVTEASRNPMLRVPVLATIYEQRVGLLAWMVSIALLAMVLSQPAARWRVALEREGALLVATTLIASVGSLVTLWAADAQGISLGIGPIVVATALLLPFGLTFGSLGAALAGWIPRATVLLLSGYAVVAYFLTQLAPLFRWPGWVENLSVFYLYGTPLTTGVYWTGFWILVAVIGTGMTIGLWSFQRRDVGR